MQDWTKLHTDLLDNPDIALMSAGEYQIFTFLLLLCRREGITDGRMVGWDDKRLAYRLRSTSEEIHAAVTRLSREDIHWLEVDEEGVIWIVNYALRQYGKPSAAPDAAKARKQKQRKRAKQADPEHSEEKPPPEQVASRGSHAAVTPPEENRGEEKREEEKREGAAAPPAPSAPKPPKKSKGETDPPKAEKTPAIMVYHSAMKLWPNGTQEGAINAAVKDVVRWQTTVDAWRLRGHKPTNVEGLIDWYRDGIPPGKPNGRGQTTDEEDRAGIRAALEGKNGHH